MRKVKDIINGDVLGLHNGDTISPGFELRWGATIEMATEALEQYQKYGDTLEFYLSKQAVRTLSTTSRLGGLRRVRWRTTTKFWPRLKFCWSLLWRGDAVRWI